MRLSVASMLMCSIATNTTVCHSMTFWWWIHLLASYLDLLTQRWFHFNKLECNSLFLCFRSMLYPRSTGLFRWITWHIQKGAEKLSNSRGKIEYRVCHWIGSFGLLASHKQRNCTFWRIFTGRFDCCEMGRYWCFGNQWNAIQRR